VANGYKEIKLSLPTRSDRAVAVSIDNLMSPHFAKDPDLLARAVRAIAINHPSLAGYDDRLALLRAIKAACAGDSVFYTEHVWRWLAQHEKDASQEELMLQTWDSFHNSQLGAE
jgi:hypothetical protein